MDDNINHTLADSPSQNPPLQKKESRAEEQKAASSQKTLPALKKSKNKAAIYKNPIFLILFAGILFRSWYFTMLKDHYSYADTATYIDPPGGIINIIRTPVYPLFLKILRAVFGENGFLNAAVFFQTMLALVAVCAFYYTAKRLLKTNLVAVPVALIVACAPPLLNWETCILTESFNISFSIFAIFFLTRYIEKPSPRRAIAIGLWCALMILLRPSNIIMPVLLGAFFVIKIFLDKVSRRNDLFGLAGVGICIAIILGFSALNYVKNDYFGISVVGKNVNQAYMLILNGLYENPEYPELSQLVADELKNTSKWKLVVKHGGVDGTITEGWGEYVNSTMKLYSKEFMEYTLEKFSTVKNHSLNVYYAKSTSEKAAGLLAIYNSIFDIRFIHGWILAAVELLYAIFLLIRKKEIPWVTIGMACIILATFFTAIYGAQGEWQRLVVHLIPLIFLLFLAQLKRAAFFCAEKLERKKEEPDIETEGASTI